MLDGLLIGLIVAAALACPAMMWLGRRGIGPGCSIPGCRPKQKAETLDDLRARQEDLLTRIAELERHETPTAERV